jgi:transposase
MCFKLVSAKETSLVRHLMLDGEWMFFEHFIRAVRAPNGRKPTNHRLVLDGVFWIARTGSPWRDLPEEFGKWSSVYRQFRRWTLAGLWEQIMDALNESGAAPDALQMVDSTVIRAHHQAAGAKGGLRARVSGAQKVALRPKFISASIRSACR